MGSVYTQRNSSYKPHQYRPYSKNLPIFEATEDRNGLFTKFDINFRVADDKRKFKQYLKEQIFTEKKICFRYGTISRVYGAFWTFLEKLYKLFRCVLLSSRWFSILCLRKIAVSFKKKSLCQILFTSGNTSPMEKWTKFVNIPS